MEVRHQLPTVAPSLCTWCALCALCYYSSPSSPRPPSCHSRHSCVVRLGVLALLLLPVLLLLLLMLLLLLRLLHPFPLPVQFVFCSICVFTLPFNAQKLLLAWLPPLALPFPRTLLLLPLQGGKEERVEVQQHALNCQLTTDAGRKILSVNITHTPHCAARPHTLLSPPSASLRCLTINLLSAAYPVLAPLDCSPFPFPTLRN